MKEVAGDAFEHSDQIDWLLTLTQEVEKIIASRYDDGGAVNMRDLSRFLRIYKRAISSEVSQLQAILHAFNSTYLMKEGVTVAKRELCL